MVHDDEHRGGKGEKRRVKSAKSSNGGKGGKDVTTGIKTCTSPFGGRVRSGQAANSSRGILRRRAHDGGHGDEHLIRGVNSKQDWLQISPGTYCGEGRTMVDTVMNTCC